MKRWIITMTAAIMAFSLCACGNEKNETPESTGREESVAETTDDGVSPSGSDGAQASECDSGIGQINDRKLSAYGGWFYSSQRRKLW